MITKPSTNLTLKVQLEEMLLVGLGAVPGALLRWLANAYLADQNLLVNLGGALLLGFLAGSPTAPKRQLLLGVGFCGSLTTFSGLMLSMLDLISEGNFTGAIGILGLTFASGLGMAAIGFYMARKAFYFYGKNN